MHPVLERLFTVDEHHRSAEAGILMADGRVELIEGEITRMESIGQERRGRRLDWSD